jgi:hypothetical protein
MKLVKYLLGLLALLFFACSNEKSSGNTLANQPKGLKYKKGDCLAYRIDSVNYCVGIISDLLTVEGSSWFCLIFTDYASAQKPNMDSMTNRKVFGRKVESAIDAEGYKIALDAEYVIDTLLPRHFVLVGNLALNEKIYIGSAGSSTTMEGIANKFTFGRERRKLPPDHYSEHLTKLDKFRPEEYFDLNEFVVD